MAPLAKAAGGYGLCLPQGTDDAPPLHTSDGKARAPGPLFTDTRDADYQAILALCRAGKTHLERIKRFDMPGFRPPAMYVREMQRFDILPEALREDASLDVYATDQAYWQSLWWQPSVKGPGLAVQSLPK